MNLRTATTRFKQIMSKSAGEACGNRRGSYILESTISLPIFIIAIVVMSSIILMFACIEDANFIAATELRRAGAEAIYGNTSALVPGRITGRLRNHSQVDYVSIKDYGYRTTRWGQDELIAITVGMGMSTDNPMNLAAGASYDVALVTRAYVGKIRNVDNMSEADMMDDGATPVYIFPKRGEKYHSEGCGFLTAASRSATLTEDLARNYKSCPLCHSKDAAIGSLVYYFPAAGESYHLPGCETLQRNYIEVSKRIALQRGYEACAKCGG